MPQFISVYITAKDEAEAGVIARALVTENLAACVNVLPKIRSVYRWQGGVEESGEAALVAKTAASLFEALRARVAGLHSYNTPCIVAWPIIAADPAYMEWLERSLPVP